MSGITNRWSAALRHKVPVVRVCSRRAQLNRYAVLPEAQRRSGHATSPGPERDADDE